MIMRQYVWVLSVARQQEHAHTTPKSSIVHGAGSLPLVTIEVQPLHALEVTATIETTH